MARHRVLTPATPGRGAWPKTRPCAVQGSQAVIEVQTRTFLAALVPLAVLLGPMILTFLWLPARVDPAVASPPAGSSFSVTATVDADCRDAVTLHVEPPLRPG